MSVHIRAGASRLALAEGSSLFVTSVGGEILSSSEHGFFVGDTRLLSRYRYGIGHRRWLLVASSPVTQYSAQLFYVNPAMGTRRGRIRRNSVALRVERTIRGGVHEDLDLTNYGSTPAALTLSIDAACDFTDIFEVRGLVKRRDRPIHTSSDPDAHEPSVTWTYERQGFRRGLSLRVRARSPVEVSTRGRIAFKVSLDPGSNWHACVLHVPIVGADLLDAPVSCHETLVEELEQRRQRWYASVASCETSDVDVTKAYRQAVEDVTELRLAAADSPVEGCVVAAGIPWFATLFGRDSLVISLQTLAVTKQFAPAVLRELGRLQATDVDDWRDAQPGKVLHEVRYGELAHFAEVPHTPYFGTADATPLYLIALHETYRWLGSRSFTEQLLPVAERALQWIDQYGDLDGDGLQEYLRRSPRGIEHQGWKDSGSSIVDEHGQLATAPIALVELQGYVYDAKRRMAELYDVVGRPDDAARLRREAVALKALFSERFWWAEEGSFYFALDGKKRPLRSVVSNAGHALWSGIATHEQAKQLAHRLLSPDMFSGWGLRTLSSAHVGFNPFAYQRGAVWPHDNGIVAMGLKRYGHVTEALQIAEAIFRAASHFESHSLPELFAGLQRTPRAFPVHYLDANVPQGWAAGSVFSLLQMILGLRADAAHGRLFIHPTLPAWLPRVSLRRLTLGAATFDLHVFREGDRTNWDADVSHGAIEIQEAPWTPDEV